MGITLGTVITILIVLAIIGVIMWLIFYVLPMPVIWRRVISVIVAILLLLWLLSRFGNMRL